MFPCIYKNIWLIGKYVEVTEDKYRGLYDIQVIIRFKYYQFFMRKYV